MGRVVLLLLVVATVVAVWYAFGPPSRKEVDPVDRRALGPDDDEDFLWQIEKERFKRRRAEQQELLDGYGRPKSADGDRGAGGARGGGARGGGGDAAGGVHRGGGGAGDARGGDHGAGGKSSEDAGGASRDDDSFDEGSGQGPSDDPAAPDQTN